MSTQANVPDRSHEERSFVANMVNARKGKGLTQAAFARELVQAGLPQMNQSAVSRIELGQRPVQLVEARVIAEVLDTSIDELLDADASASLLNDAVRLWGSAHEQADEAIAAVQACREYWSRIDRMLVDLEAAYGDDEREPASDAVRNTLQGLRATREIDLPNVLQRIWDGDFDGIDSSAPQR